MTPAHLSSGSILAGNDVPDPPLSGGWDEQAHYYSDGAQYVWTPAEGIGEQIGVCGADVDKGGGFAIYEIVDDEGRTFLYTAPRKFYSGGVESRLWMRDGVTLEAPAAEMVSFITVISKNAGGHFGPGGRPRYDCRLAGSV